MTCGAPPALSPARRTDNLRRLREETFDVLIVGGGINGAGIARDLALRAAASGAQLRIGLVEQRHFASGTSGRNSQLIHGGLRYLKQLQFGLVKEALEERATLLRIAPHLVEPLPFLVPMYGVWARAYYGAGLLLYDLLAGRHNLGRSRFLSREQVRSVEPGLSGDGLHSAGLFWDCRVESARLVLANIADAARMGVAAANYARAQAWKREGELWRVEVADALGGDVFPVRARKLVDARGPWEGSAALRLVRGSHIVLPRVNAGGHVIAHFGADGRILFIIPWGPGDALSLVGTTDVDHAGGADQAAVSGDEVRYLLAIVRGLFPRAEHMEPIAAYSSLRPLVASGAASPTSASREHRIWNSPDGVLHVGGGKYTTYRRMSEQAAGMVCGEIAPELARGCQTAQTPIGGNTHQEIAALREQAPEMAARHGLETEEVAGAIRLYGVEAPRLFAMAPESPADGLGRLELARIAWAVEHEMAHRLADLLFVSTYWGYHQPPTEVRFAPAAAAMGRLLGWDAARREREIALAVTIAALPR